MLKNFIKKLGVKSKDKNGFTLAELLVVVAIIGVLVTVSIPIFTAQLEKSREATDMANLRSAKAAAVTVILGDENDALYTALTSTGVYYDTQNGVLTATAPSNGSLVGTTAAGSYDGTNEYGYNSATDYKGHNIKITYNATTNAITYDLTGGATTPAVTPVS